MKVYSLIYTITRNKGNNEREYGLSYYYPMHFKSESSAKKFGDKLKNGEVKLIPEENVTKYEIKSSNLNVDRLNKFINKFNSIISKSKLKVPKIPLFEFNKDDSDWATNTGLWRCNLNTSFAHWIGIIVHGDEIEVQVKNAYGDVSYKSLKTLLENNGVKTEKCGDKCMVVKASAESKTYAYHGQVITASSKEEAIKQVVAREIGDGNNVKDRIYKSAKKVYDIIGNNKLVLQKNGCIILKASKRLKESLGIGGDWNVPIIILGVETGWEGHHFAQWTTLYSNVVDSIDDIKLDWDNKKTETIVKNAYNKVKKTLSEKLIKISKEADSALKSLQ